MHSVAQVAQLFGTSRMTIYRAGGHRPGAAAVGFTFGHQLTVDPGSPAAIAAWPAGESSARATVE